MDDTTSPPFFRESSSAIDRLCQLPETTGLLDKRARIRVQALGLGP